MLPARFRFQGNQCTSEDFSTPADRLGQCARNRASPVEYVYACPYWPFRWQSTIAA